MNERERGQPAHVSRSDEFSVNFGSTLAKRVPIGKAMRSVRVADFAGRAADSRRRRRRVRIGVVVLLVLGGIPASAAVIVKNYMATQVTRATECLIGVAGTDPLTFPTGFPSIATSSDVVTTAEGVPLLRQIITVRGVQPERTVAADAVRIRNRCSRPINVTVTTGAHGVTAPAVAGEWKDLSMRVYLSKTATAAPASDALPPIAPTALIAPGASFTDPTVAASWDATPLSVSKSAGGVGSIVGTSTGTVSLAANQDLQVGLVIDAGSQALPSDAVLRLIVTAGG